MVLGDFACDDTVCVVCRCGVPCVKLDLEHAGYLDPCVVVYDVLNVSCLTLVGTLKSGVIRGVV